MVPPTSTTTPSDAPDRNAAPVMLFVGPEERLSTGNSAAAAALAIVPSFRAMKSGASVPMADAASANARVTRTASGRNAAFSSPALSRPRSPIRPSRRDWVIEASGWTSWRISAARASALPSSGANTALRAI